MRPHTTRVAAALLAFALGAGAANLFPARRRQSDERAAPGATTAADRRAPQSATVTVADTPKPVAPRIKQTLVTSFPTLGLVRLQAVENFGERMRVEAFDVKTDSPLAIFPAPVEEAPRADAQVANPFLRFRVVRARGLPGPVVFVVAVTPGGSGHGFSAMLIGEVGGRLKVLNEETLFADNQSGIHVGALGGRAGAGAAVWRPMWEDGGHYAPHRYEVTLYRFDPRRRMFVKSRVLESEREYEGHGEGALKELGLDYTDLLQDMTDVSDYHWL